jgi:cyanate lyase
MENKKIKKDKKITLYDILMMCGLDEIIDVVYNGVVVIKAKEAKAVVDLLDVLEDKLLNALVYKLVDNFGKIKIYTADAETENKNG